MSFCLLRFVSLGKGALQMPYIIIVIIINIIIIIIIIIIIVLFFLKQ